MICYDYTDFQIIKKVNVKVKLNLSVTFCPLNALFNFAAWVGFCRKFKNKQTSITVEKN